MLTVGVSDEDLMGTNPKGWRGSHPIGYLAFNLDGLTKCDIFFLFFTTKCFAF